MKVTTFFTLTFSKGKGNAFDYQGNYLSKGKVNAFDYQGNYLLPYLFYPLRKMRVQCASYVLCWYFSAFESDSTLFESARGATLVHLFLVF